MKGTIEYYYGKIYNKLFESIFNHFCISSVNNKTQGILKYIPLIDFSLDSSSVKVHPDGTGALKKRRTGFGEVLWRLEHEDTHDGGR
jgi:hypothetical protein